MIQAVIFNLDGVLVSTDDCHFHAWAQMAQEQGIPLNRNTYLAMVGMKRMDNLRMMLKKAERAYTPMEMWALAARKNDLFNALIEDLTPDHILPGALDTLIRLRTMGVKTAVGSSSENAGGILRKLSMDKLFDAVVDGEQIEKGKPDPEVFLLIARKLAMPTSECLVVENSAVGVEAGKQAGMKVLPMGMAAKRKERNFYPMSLHDIDLPRMLQENTIGDYVI